MDLPIPLWFEVKAVTGESIKDAKGNKVCAAVCTRIDRPATFSDYANPAEVKRVIPLDAAIEMDQHNASTGAEPRLIAFAAKVLGFLLVKLPSATVAACDVTALCKMATKSAEAIAAFGLARADGVTTPEEARLVRQKIAEAQTAFAELDARLAIIEKGGVA